MDKIEESIAQLSMCLDVIDDGKDDIKKLIEKLTRYCNYAEDYIQILKEIYPEKGPLELVEWHVDSIKIFLKNIKKNIDNIGIATQNANLELGIRGKIYENN